jgi:hypothetical protein
MCHRCGRHWQDHAGGHLSGTCDPPESVWIGRGQCIEHHGAGEAYLPLLKALAQVGRAPDGTGLVTVLHQQSPSWLVHLPVLVPLGMSEVLQQRAGSSTRECMLRELAEAVEALTAQRPLVLVLEDLHWCDGATPTGSHTWRGDARRRGCSC